MVVRVCKNTVKKNFNNIFKNKKWFVLQKLFQIPYKIILSALSISNSTG